MTALLSILGLMLGEQAHATGYTLIVYSQGSGTIAENPTNSSYPSGVTVTLTATPSNGWYFANWSGDASGTNNPLNVTMNSNLVITGAFLAYPTYTLSLVTNGQGTIALNPPGGSYYSNTTVTVTATPASGWLFTGWSGTATGTNNPLSVTLDASSSLTGTFVQLPAFDLPPVNVTNAVGSDVTFTAHAVGTAPVYYQWFFNNGPLTNATNPTLTITNAPLTDAGNYWVVATNAYGSVTSSVVVLALTNAFGSTNVVSSPTDANLRSAIAAGGWVSIACNGTFNLTNTINITQNTTLDGSGISAIISGGNAYRLFNVAPGVSFSVTNLTLANGNYTNVAPAYGGAIYNNVGTLTLVSCTLTNNHVQLPNKVGTTSGGTIFNNGGSIYLYGSSFSNNSAVANGDGDGGVIYSTTGSVIIVNCSFLNNLCTAANNPGSSAAGGALCQAAGSLYITNSTFIGNLAAGYSGGPYSPGAAAYGGAIAAMSGSVFIDHSKFVGNTVQGGNGFQAPGALAYGGAIYSVASLTAGWSTFSGNNALAGESEFSAPPGCGGAIYNNNGAELNDCSIYSNNARGSAAVNGVQSEGGGNGFGGGIFNNSELVITNCTVALNSATAGSGTAVDTFYPYSPAGTNGSALGGGIFNSNSQCVVMNCTIATNLCVINGSGFVGTGGFAAGSDVANTNGTFLLQNSLLAYGGTNGNSYGPIIDQGYNISSDGTANLFGGASYNFTDPQLAPLANNGGPTLTMALLPTSPAIGLGTYVGAPTNDQRGYPRPTTSTVDSGAYEYVVVSQAPTLQIGAGTNSVVISFAATATNVYILQSSTNLKTWVNVNTNGPLGYSTNFSETLDRQGTAKFFRLWLQ